MTMRTRKAAELAEMIKARMLGTMIHHIEVRPSPIYGWEPIVMASPHRVAEYQATADRIAKELRAEFKLAP